MLHKHLYYTDWKYFAFGKIMQPSNISMPDLESTNFNLLNFYIYQVDKRVRLSKEKLVIIKSNMNEFLRRFVTRRKHGYIRTHLSPIDNPQNDCYLVKIVRNVTKAQQSAGKTLNQYFLVFKWNYFHRLTRTINNITERSWIDRTTRSKLGPKWLSFFSAYVVHLCHYKNNSVLAFNSLSQMGRFSTEVIEPREYSTHVWKHSVSLAIFHGDCQKRDIL